MPLWSGKAALSLKKLERRPLGEGRGGGDKMERIGQRDRTNEAPLEMGDWPLDGEEERRAVRRWNGANAPEEQPALLREAAEPTVQLKKAEIWPAGAIDPASFCPLEIRFPHGLLFATGWLTGPQTVVTAGQALFDPRLGGWAEAVLACPLGGDAALPPYPSVSATALDVTEDSQAKVAAPRHLGVLHLAAPVGPANEGFLQAATLLDEAFSGQDIEIAGYGAQADRHRDMNDRPLTRLKGRALGIDRRHLYYCARIPAGLCGAPVLLREPERGRLTVVAVHVGGMSSGGFGSAPIEHAAVRITPDCLEQLENWRRGPGPQSRSLV